MTDYLDELLMQQEQEGEQVLEWRRYRLPRWRSEERREGAAGSEVPNRQGQTVQENVAPEAGVVRILALQMERLSRSARRAQRLSVQRRTSGGQGVADVDGSLFHGQMSRKGTVNYAELLDAAFRRDARRYDGPLGLL